MDCAEYSLEVLQSKWEIPPRVDTVDFQIQTDQQVMTNQMDIVVLKKQEKKAVVKKHQEGGAQEAGEIPRVESRNTEVVESQSLSRPSGHKSTWCCDAQTGRVAQTDPRKIPQRSFTEECNPRNT